MAETRLRGRLADILEGADRFAGFLKASRREERPANALAPNSASTASIRAWSSAMRPPQRQCDRAESKLK